MSDRGIALSYDGTSTRNSQPFGDLLSHQRWEHETRSARSHNPMVVTRVRAKTE